MTPGDKTVVAVILIVAVSSAGLILLWNNHFMASGPVEVVIEVDGQEMRRGSLSVSELGEQYRIRGVVGYSLLEVGDNKIRMVESPCPDKICIGTGWISHPGESIICIPNRIIVRLVSGVDYHYDGLSQ
ncbi:MAG TPA: NusG domain II-containing protein [bacterium]|jgi:hypothetical protein|nr:NusG domain II-containing protein [bacterium]